MTAKVPEAAALFPSPGEAETVADALRRAAVALRRSNSPFLDAQLLLAHLLKTSRASLLAHDHDELAPEMAAAFQELIERRATGVPIAYLRGYVEWFGLHLEVTPEVLIPRPETEQLVERVLALVRGREIREIADIGAGSGAISVALGLHLPDAKITAVDSSSGALQVAGRNVFRHGLSQRITLRRGHLLEPLTMVPDVLVANLPYLSDGMMSQVPIDVTHEPKQAMWAGPSGLEIYSELVEEMAARRWSPLTVIEIDPRQSAAVTGLIHRYFPAAPIEISRDYAGLDRVVSFPHRARLRD